MSETDPASNTSEHRGLPWAQVARRSLEGTGPPTYDVWIVSIRPGRRSAVGARLAHLLRDVRGRSGAPRLVLVEERAHHPGNLIGTLLTWRDACGQCADMGVDLDAQWRAGQIRVALIHGAGQGRRAAPLAHAEQGDRGSLLLPGSLHGQPARLLESVMVQMMPLAASQSPGYIDVIWASQLFLPTLAPNEVPSPTTPISKLVTTTAAAAEASEDVGRFSLTDGVPTAFVRQGDSTPIVGGEVAYDLGSFRLRADALDALQSVYLTRPPDGPRDLDPHLTAPLLGSASEHRIEAERVREALGGQTIIGVTDVGTDVPWWRLRRPAELRDAALSLIPSGREPALQHLLGIDHPIQRSWLGTQWIEGPELSWKQVEDGVETGGVHIKDSIVHDSSIWGWHEQDRSSVGRCIIDSSVLSCCAGGFDIEACWAVLSGRPGLRGGGGLAWRITSAAPHEAGPSPTVLGLCEVRRPRLMDGRATFHGFLDEDAKATEHELRGRTGVSWAKLARLPAHHGPDPTDFTALDGSTPHEMHAIPPEALALLREGVPAGSYVAKLLDLADKGAFTLATHQGSRPTVGVEGTILPGRQWHEKEGSYRLHLDAETWDRWRWSPPRLAEAVLRCWLQHFLPPAAETRAALTERRLHDWRRQRYTANPSLMAELDLWQKAGDIGRILSRLGDWALSKDPDGCDLAALFASVDALAPRAKQAASLSELRGWCRWRLDHVGDDAPSLTAHLSGAAPELLEAGGFIWSHRWVDGGRERWIPSMNLLPDGPATRTLRPDALTDRLASRLKQHIGKGPPPSLGVCGPAASGKSSLAVRLAESLDSDGFSVGYIEADQACWQGDGFRYTQGDTTRSTQLFGPAIVDEVGLARRIRHERARCDIVIVEGCFVGLDHDVYEQLDLLVGVVLHDPERLAAKHARDTLGGGRRIDVVTDFAAKTHHENQDGVAPALAKASLVWDRSTGRVWERGLHAK